MEKNMMMVMHKWSQYEQGQVTFEREVEEERRDDEDEKHDPKRDEGEVKDEDSSSDDLFIARRRRSLRVRSLERRIQEEKQSESVQEVKANRTHGEKRKKEPYEIIKDFEMRKQALIGDEDGDEDGGPRLPDQGPRAGAGVDAACPRGVLRPGRPGKAPRRAGPAG